MRGLAIGKIMRNSTINRRITHLQSRLSACAKARAASFIFRLTEAQEHRRLQALLDTGYVVEGESGFEVAAATPAEDREWAERLARLLTETNH
jgi:hypothetical protein